MTTAPIKLFDGCYGRDRTGKVHGPMIMSSFNDNLFLVRHNCNNWFRNGESYVFNQEFKQKEHDIIQIVDAPSETKE